MILMHNNYSSAKDHGSRLHGVSVDCYADDTQLDAAFDLEEESVVLDKLEKCISAL